MPTKKPTSEAPESNAGDDFHRLWASRKALELINFDDEGLKLLAVEGVAPTEASKIDPIGDKLLAVDLTEYYAGENFSTAKKVVISQLKYSTRHEDKEYTLAQLCQGKKGNPQKSVLGKLATAFKQYSSSFELEEVASKLQIKLVSNRPINKNLITEFRAIQNGLASTENSGFDQLVSAFPLSKKAIKRLISICDLSHDEFIVFLKALNFEDANTGSRFLQKKKIINQLVKLDTKSFKHHFNALYLLINDLMMPEKRSSNEISIHDIIFAFELGSVERLFPAPPKFQEVSFQIPRAQISDIAKQIISSSSTNICLHGSAGIGKTSIVRSLPDFMPTNSICITYDCYGQGEYLNSGELRHLPSNAVIQIANELVQFAATDFLIAQSLNDYGYITELKNRMIKASELLISTDPDALLIFFIDAADNSVSAARQKDQLCFIHQLSSMGKLPVNCRIVYTTRTGRKESLNLHGKYTDIAISSFSKIESTKHLKSYFELASDQQADKFHTLTEGNPRVQYYALQNRENLDMLFEFLEPYGKSVGTLIDGQIEEATTRFGDPLKAKNILSNLIELPRPIPTDFVAESLDSSSEEIKDFCRDLSSGLIIKENLISFRDEDFEAYLNEEYRDAKNWVPKHAEIFLDKAKSSYYASANIADILRKAGKRSELYDIVLSNKYLEIIGDPFSKQTIYNSRCQIAMQAADQTKDHLTFVKLLWKAGQAVKNDKIRLQIISRNVEIMVNRGDLRLIQQLYLDLTSNREYGASNWECASILARRGVTEKAKKHLIQGEIWNDWRQSLKREDRHNRKIDFDDKHIAASCEAHLRLNGVKEVKWEVVRWKHKKIRLSILRLLIERVSNTSDRIEIQAWFNQISRTDALVLIAEENLLANKGLLIDYKALLTRLETLLKKGVKLPKKLGSAVITLYEETCQQDGVPSNLPNLVSYFRPSEPENIPYFTSNFEFEVDIVENLDCLLRFLAISKAKQGKQIKPEQLFSKKIEKLIEEEENSRRYTNPTTKEETESFYKQIIPLYEFRAKALLSANTFHLCNELKKEFKKILPQKDPYNHNYHRHDFLEMQLYCLNRIVDLERLTNNKKTFFGTLIDLAPSNMRVHQLLASRIACFPDSHSLVYQLLAKLNDFASDSSRKASDRIKIYEDCIQICLKMKDQEEAEIYFNKAVEVSDKIDLQVFDQIPAISSITERITSDNNYQLAFDLGRLLEYGGVVLDGYDNFPWTDGIRGIRNLDFGSSLAVWCRWDHRNVELDSNDHWRYWSENLSHLLDKKLINPSTIFALTKMDFFHSQFKELLDRMLEKLICNQSENLRSILDILERELTVYCSLKSKKDFLKIVLSILEKHSLDQDPVVIRIKEFYNNIVQFDPVENSPERPVVDDDKNQSDEKVKLLIEEIDPQDTSQIIDTLVEIKNGNFYYGAEQSLLQGLKGKCEPRDYIAFLNILQELPVKLISQYSFEDVLESCLSDWSIKQTVQVWKKEQFKAFVNKYLLDFRLDEAEVNYFSYGSLVKLGELFDKDEKELAEVLKGTFSKIINQVDAEFIYQSFNSFSHLLTSDQAIAFVEWVLPDLLKEVDTKSYDGMWDHSFIPPLKTEEQISGFLRYRLGHPDKENRWPVLHTLQYMAKIEGKNSILDSLISSRDEFTCHPFQHREHYFYHLSAKLWLFVACENISRNHPEAIAHHFDVFKGEALRGENNHLLIRWFAQSVCLKLIKYDSSITDDQAKKEIQDIFDGKYPLRHYKYGELEDFEVKEKTDFDFDGLNTEPYWFEWLGKIFGVTTRSVSSIADRFISDYFKYQGNAIQQDHVKVSSRDWAKKYNRKGTIPQIEGLHTYFEYHAMFMVANYLLENRAQVEPKYHENLVGWLESWGLRWKEGWIAEHRDITPLEKTYWVPDETNHKEWKWSVSKEYIDCKFYKGLNNGSISVHNQIRLFNGKNHEDIGITSVLVQRKTAKSLLRTLQTMRDSYDYGLPVEGESRDFGISNGIFQLSPFVQNEDGRESAMDEYDHNSLDLYKFRILPCSDFITFFDLAFDDNSKKGFIKNDETNIVSELEIWSDFDEHRDHYSYNDFGTKGINLKIRKAELLQFLKANDQALISECIISRYVHKESDDYDEDDRYYGYNDRYTRIYLTHADGTTETL